MVENNNLRTWSRVRVVPPEAKKQIGGGRLKGMTDINPMWRIKMLTEVYGPCGTGWYYDILKKELVDGANGEVAAFVDIQLFVKEGEEWSKGIPGTGGSMYVAKEKSGLYTSDEAYKMALTDALSVSCKALGFGAEVYWSGDRTKYERPDTGSQGDAMAEKLTTERPKPSEVEELFKLAERKGFNRATVATHCQARFHVEVSEIDKDQYKKMHDGYSKMPDEFAGTPFEG